MNLDKLQVHASMRSGWQSLDLGFLMARAWWRPLLMASLIPALPLMIVLLIIFAENPFWAVFIVWWLKPFCERLPLFTASRLLFDEAPAPISNLQALRLKNSFPWLLWRRL